MDYGAVPHHDETDPLEMQDDIDFSLRDSNKKRLFAQAPSSLIKQVCAFAGLAGAILAVIAVIRTSRDSATRSSGGDTVSPPANLQLLAASPEEAFGFRGVEREEGAEPSSIWGEVEGPYPTNSWYLNLVSHRASFKPDDMTRAYTVPYIIDTAPADDMAGIRVHWPVVKASDSNVQMVNDFKNGVSLGTADTDVDAAYRVDEDEDMSHLGVSLKWGDKSKKGMVTHIVRGMPYATIRYYGGALPAFHSYNAPDSVPLIDGKTELDCEGGSEVVEKEIQLHFRNSDFTWSLFFSKPVKVSCKIIGDDINVAQFKLNVSSYDDDDDDEPLTARVALIDQCTTGKSDIHQHCAEKAEWKDPDGYIQLLKERAAIFPTSPKIDFAYPDEASPACDRNVQITVDWKAKGPTSEDDTDDLIMFALPHHQEDVADSMTEHCIPTFHGPSCLVEGKTWSLVEDISTPVSYTAGRPPEAEIIPQLAKALHQDIHYRLADNMMLGAADTYFSGKILARLGRIIAIASELKTLAEGSVHSIKPLYDDDVEDAVLAASIKAAGAANLPSDEDIDKAVRMLSKGVEIWLSTEAEATYVYDRSWGGFVNCGCKYTGKGEHGHCKNKFPDCPALSDVNEDFGNGFYNDHHFHYGYNVYAAAVVAKNDPVWAAENFDRVLLYIRDIANPSADDKYFPQFRQKDWFLGSSWAAGIVSAENSPHGRNQESSSEAIAAYEGIALYGAAMVDIFSKSGHAADLELAKLVRDAGQLLTSTELRAANRYWHVWSSDDHVNTYPPAYTKPVVGMLYETMASFQTWFAPYAVVSYGIQLIPFTPIGEYRDDVTWATDLYPLYEESCEAVEDFCIDNGWSILQAGLLATTGKRKEALEQALEIPAKVYATDGGIGNSPSNTIWYIATRKPVNDR